MLDYAVDALADLPDVTTYLDGTHSAWLGVGDIADRLAQAGVADADGFYLNVSNYQFTANNGITAAGSRPAWPRHGRRGRRLLRLPQPVLERWPVPGQDRRAARRVDRVALSSFGEWSDDSDDPALNTSGINLRYSTMLGSVEPTRAT